MKRVQDMKGYAMLMRIFAAAMVMATVAAAAPTSKVTLVGDTNRPEMSFYIPGEAVKLRFTVDGLGPQDKELTLNVRVVDAKGAELDRRALQVPNDKPKWEVELDAPVIGLGYYRVNADLSNGVTLPQLGNRWAGFLTYAVVPDPATRKVFPVDQTYFGMQGGFNQTVNALPYLGVRWVMDGQFGWSRTEPDRPGQLAAKLAPGAKDKFPLRDDEAWKWCKIPGKDGGKAWKVYSVATGIVCPAPKWAQADPARFPRQGALSPEGEKAFRDYCLAVGKAYATLYPERERHCFEVTWEPCVPWNFKGTVDDVVKIYEIAYPALHEADPKAFVIGPCAAGINTSGLQELEEHLKKGLGKYLDGFSVHPYHAQPCESEGIVANLRATKELLRKYIGKDIPLFGTEMGYSHWGSPGYDLEHAQRITRENLILLGEGFQFNMAFYFHDMGTSVFSNDSGYGFVHNLIPSVPFGPGKVSPKPAAAAFAALSWIVEGHQSAGAIEWLGDTAWGYAYENSDDVVLALWDFGDQPRQVSIPVGVPEVELFDWMGNGAKVNAPEGRLQVTLRQEPLYIRGAARTLWGKNAAKPIAVAAGRLAGFPGSDTTLAGTLLLPSSDKPFEGVLAMEADQKSGIRKASKPVKLEPGKAMPFSFVLPLPPDIGRGVYPVKLVLEDKDGRSVAAAGTRLEVEPPVAMERIAPVVKPNGVKGFAITLREAQGKGLEGSVTARLERVPESELSATFSLGANETKTIELERKDLAVSPLVAYDAIISLGLKNGYSFAERTRVNFLAATKLAAPPKLDCDLAEWKDIPAIELAGLDNVVRSPKYYSGEKADVRFAWDAKALYFAVDAEDKAHVQPNTGCMIWQGDCLQFGFNIDHGKKFELSGNGLADMSRRARRSEVAFALTKDGPQVYRHLTYDPEKLKEGLVPPDAIPLVAAWKDGRQVYEAAIPWKELGFDAPPQEGDVIGMSLSINNADDPAQPDPTALGIFDLKKADRFGMLTLGGARQQP